jgi:hypothetical protein
MDSRRGPQGKRVEQIIDTVWSKAEPTRLVRRKKADTTVLSVRMSRSTLRLLVEIGRELGKGPATLARELIEQGIALKSGKAAHLAVRVLERVLEEFAPQGGREGSDRQPFFTTGNYSASFNEFKYAGVQHTEFPDPALRNRIGLADIALGRSGALRAGYLLSLSGPVSEGKGPVDWWRGKSDASQTRPPSALS